MNGRLPSFSTLSQSNSNSHSYSRQSLNGQSMTDNYGAIEAPPPCSRSSSQDLYNDNDSILDDEGQEFDQLIRTYERSWKRDLEEVTAETNAKVAELIREYERPSLSLWSTFLNGMLVLGVGVLIFFTAISVHNYTDGSKPTDSALQPKEIVPWLGGEPSKSPTTNPSPTSYPIKSVPTISNIPSDATVTHASPASLYDGGILIEGQFGAMVTNEYTSTGKTMFPYPFLEGALLLEPYRESTITMFGASTCTLQWTLTPNSLLLDPSLTQSGSTTGNSYSNVFYITPTKTGKYLLTVIDTCSQDKSYRFTQTVWVKYVRRELQSLNENDRTEFLDAFHTLWEVNTRDGIEKYGKTYKSLYYFALLHNDGGGNGICDEFHAGSGFINNHLYLGAYLEQSLRLVNPRVSLHYMEYSKYFESEQFQSRATTLDGGTWTELMTDKWFGSNDPVTGEIMNSRWAHQAIPYLDKSFFESELIDENHTFFPVEEDQWLAVHPTHLASPYGLLRSPWNYNPSPFLTRYNNMHQIQFNNVVATAKIFYMGSDCAEYQSFVKKYAVGQTYQTYLTESEDNVHGKVHFTIGGAGGTNAKVIDDLLKSKYGWTDDDLMFVSRGSQAVYKSFVPRKWVATNPLSCTADPWQPVTTTATVRRSLEETSEVSSVLFSSASSSSSLPPPSSTSSASLSPPSSASSSTEKLPLTPPPPASTTTTITTSPTTPTPIDASITSKTLTSFTTDKALTTTAAPGEINGPSCTCDAQYLTDEDQLTQLISFYAIKNANFIYSLDFDDRKAAMQLVCSRMAFDGDMASSGAAMDPMFWVAHGAIERLYQRVIFEGVLADHIYVNPKRNECSGHTADGTKHWLSGYYLQDESIDTSLLSNAELADILNPHGDKYRDLLDFVYEDRDWAWCNGFDAWFGTTR